MYYLRYGVEMDHKGVWSFSFALLCPALIMNSKNTNMSISNSFD